MNHQRPSELRSLVRLIEWRAEHVPDRVALSAWAGGGWRELTYQKLWRDVEALGSSLIAHGVARGDRVVLRSESRPEWGVAFFAILYAGAIAVPVDPRIDEGELQRIVEHCGARLILTSTTTMAPASISEPRDRPDDVAVIAYTSGTMGNPKGVMITTASLLYEMRSLSAVHNLKEDDVFLSILPLNHLLELTCGLLSVLYAGGEVLYAGTLLPADLAEKMQTRGVTSMIAVPALYRTLKKTVESLYASAAHFRVRQNLARAVPHRWRQFLFPELRRVAGHRVRRFICGGSPLDRDTFRFFNFLGAPIYQGYGLTETSPVVAVNGPRANRAESVGPPLPGTEVAIAADGEILVRGPQVMRGYYNAPELTAETIDADGRLHTGDLGTIEDGFLYVTGRLKELIVLADGRKVQPQEVESAIGQCALVKEVCVVPVEGERGEEVCAIVVSAAPSQDVERDVRKLVTQLRDFKRPHRILVRSEELPKTRTMKVRRKEVQNWATQRIGTPDS